MTSSSRISGGGLKKCMPTTRSGRPRRGAIEVIGIDDVFEASTARGAISRERPEQLALDLERLGRGLDDELAAGEVLERGRALQPRARRGRLLGAPAPALGAAVEVLRDALERALDGRGIGVEEQRPRARQRAELRDPRSHRPRADDADDLRCPAHARER